MDPNYTVRADVFDVRHYSPKANEQYMVDSNVWYFATSQRASQDASNPPYQTLVYPPFLEDCLHNGANLYHCNLSMAELAACYEDEEYESSGCAERKTFRHNYPDLRKNWLKEFLASLRWIRRKSGRVDVMPDLGSLNAGVLILSKAEADVYDLWICHAMNASNIMSIITDDVDLITVPDIRVLTANSRAIRAALKAGRMQTDTDVRV